MLLATIGRFHFLEQARALEAAGRLTRHYCDDPRVLSLGRRGAWLPRVAAEFRWRCRSSPCEAHRWAGSRLARLARVHPAPRINSAFALETLRQGDPAWVDHGSLDERWVRHVLDEEARAWGAPLMSQGGNHGKSWLVDRQSEEFERAVGVVVASELAKQTLVSEGVPGVKIRVVTLGVDRQRFQPLPFREPGRPFRFVHAGPVSFNKGVHRLIRAFGSLLIPRAELWIVGSFANDSTERWLRRQARGLPVRFLPPVPQPALPRLFSQCDAFVLASLADGFGLTVLQALACGVPAVVSRWAGCSGILPQNGPVRVTGIEVRELAESMASLREWRESSGPERSRTLSRESVDGLDWPAHAACLARQMEAIA